MGTLKEWEELTNENLVKTKSDTQGKLFRIGKIEKLLRVYNQSHFDNSKIDKENINTNNIKVDANLSKIIAEFDYLTDESNEPPSIKDLVKKYNHINYESFDKKREEIKKYLHDKEELNG